MADPVIVSSLIKKRSELAGLVDAKRGELNTILRDLDHVDAVVRLFAPEKVPELLPVKRRPSDRTFARNELTRRIFNILREAGKPATASASQNGFLSGTGSADLKHIEERGSANGALWTPIVNKDRISVNSVYEVWEQHANDILEPSLSAPGR